MEKKDQKKTTSERKKDQTAESIPVKNNVYIKDPVQPNQTVYIMDPAQSTEMYNISRTQP